MEWNANRNVNCFRVPWDGLKITWGIEYCKVREQHVMWAKAHTFDQAEAEHLSTWFCLERPVLGDMVEDLPQLDVWVPVFTINTSMEKVLKESPGVDHSRMKLHLRQFPIPSFGLIGISHLTEVLVGVSLAGKYVRLIGK